VLPIEARLREAIEDNRVPSDARAPSLARITRFASPKKRRAAPKKRP
jgi:hypothetical protein